MGDHSEAIEIEYDPDRVSYSELLERFFAWHNPLRVKRTQYRSAVLVRCDEEERLAGAAVSERSKKVPGGLATAVERLGEFWPAEDYHQKYRLRRGSETVRALESVVGSGWHHSEAATKLNAHAGGHPVDLSGLPGSLLSTLD